MPLDSPPRTLLALGQSQWSMRVRQETCSSEVYESDGTTAAQLISLTCEVTVGDEIGRGDAARQLCSSVLGDAAGGRDHKLHYIALSCARLAYAYVLACCSMRNHGTQLIEKHYYLNIR